MPLGDGRRRLRRPTPPRRSSGHRCGGWLQWLASRGTARRLRPPLPRSRRRPTGGRNTPTAPPGARCRGRESSRRTRRSLPPPDGSPAPGVQQARSVDPSVRRAPPDTPQRPTIFSEAMRSVEEHQRVVAALITARPAVTAELPDAEGRALSDDVTATVSLPVFDNSAMDGYAVRADEVASATSDHPVKLLVAEDIPAGRIDVPALGPGTAHRIMTGAPVPAGATAIVPVEATDGRTDVVSINAPSVEGKHIRRAGEDVAEGATVLRAGQVVTPAVVGLAAALGLHELTVIPG